MLEEYNSTLHSIGWTHSREANHLLSFPWRQVFSESQLGLPELPGRFDANETSASTFAIISD